MMIVIFRLVLVYLLIGCLMALLVTLGMNIVIKQFNDEYEKYNKTYWYIIIATIFEWPVMILRGTMPFYDETKHMSEEERDQYIYDGLRHVKDMVDREEDL